MDQLPQIRDQLNSKQLFEAFKLQLKKDFDECACNTDFIDLLIQDFDSIKTDIVNQLKINEKKSHFNLQQLLYRIDLNEKQLSKYLNEHPNSEYLEILAEFIIKRILQKVVLRMYFKDH